MNQIEIPHWTGTMEGSGEAAWDESQVRRLVREVEIWKAAYAEEAQKFQAETRRTSELATGIRVCRDVLMDSVVTHSTQGSWIHDEAKRLNALLTPNAEVRGETKASPSRLPGSVATNSYGEKE